MRATLGGLVRVSWLGPTFAALPGAMFGGRVRGSGAHVTVAFEGTGRGGRCDGHV